jgi:hypothetical protein
LGRTCVPSAIHHQGENLGALNILRTASRCPILRRFSPYARASPSLRQGIDPRPSIPATRCWIIGTKRPPHTKAVVSILGSLIVSPSLPFLCGIPLGPVRSLIFWNPDLAFVHRFLPTLSLLSVFSSPLCFLCLSGRVAPLASPSYRDGSPVPFAAASPVHALGAITTAAVRPSLEPRCWSKGPGGTSFNAQQGIWTRPWTARNFHSRTSSPLPMGSFASKTSDCPPSVVFR